MAPRSRGRMTGHALQLIVISSAREPGLDGLVTATLDGILLLRSGDDAAVRSAAAKRPDVPLIVLADLDADASLRLIAAGADDVLPEGAAMDDIVHAVQRAAARKRRDQAAGDDRGPRAVSYGRLPPQLEAIGRLADGVAQDFNNLLMIIEGHTERLLETVPAADPIRGRVSAIAAASRQGVALTQKLLAFGRRQAAEPAAQDVNAIVGECAPLLRRRLGGDVRLVTRLDPDLPLVRADRAQLVQVLLNLAGTSAEAMPGGGTFTIATDLVTADAEMRRSRPWLASGLFVRLQLTDTGAGIEAQALPHVFEPFHGGTRGDGLDLPSVYGVVKQSGGFIWVDSEPGQGTRVTVLLPPLVDDARTAAVDAAAARVLLVEDNAEVRQLLIDALTAHGVRVIAVGSAEEALDVAAQQRFDLLLTDVGLPGATGTELARRVRRRSPRLPILFISGQSGEMFSAEADLASPRGFLQKPFSSRALLATLQELLKSDRV
jgi:signal transduction histidine kinase